MKLLGAGIVLLAALGIGLLLRQERRRHLASLRELVEALRLMEGELGLRRAPMAELLTTVAEQSEPGAALFCRCLSLSLTRLGEQSFASLWRECVDRCLPELAEAERQELRQLGQILGRFELSRQLGGLESCRMRLQLRLEQEEARYLREKKLLLALPLSFACLLVLLIV